MGSKLKALVLLVIPVISLFAGPPDTLWTKTFGGAGSDVGYWVEQTTDGGYILVGYTSGAGNKDVWLIKTDANGNKLWDKTFGGDSADEGHCVQQTNDGGYIIGGITRSYGAGLEDIWLIKTDSLGNPLWTKTYGGDSSETDIYGTRVCVDQTADDGYVIVGTTISYGAGKEDVWFIKTDSLGDTLWTRTFGGSSRDCGAYVEQTTDAGYIIVGTTFSYDVGWGDFWLIKTDSFGNKQWDKVYGHDGPEFCNSAQQTTDGGYIIVGMTLSVGPPDVWLLKTDSLGDTLWAKIYGKENVDENGYYVCQTIDGGYIFTGHTGSNLWLAKTDQSGDTLWTRNFPNGFWGYCVRQTTDSGYSVVGEKGADVLLVKFGAEPGIEEEKVGSGKLEVRSLKISPSPIKGWVEIHYYLPERTNVNLRIFDIQGKLVRTVFKDTIDAGHHKVNLDCQDLPAGVYFVKMESEASIEVEKLTIVR